LEYYFIFCTCMHKILSNKSDTIELELHFGRFLETNGQFFHKTSTYLVHLAQSYVQSQHIKQKLGFQVS
jgi:hypothetical protein